MFDLQKECRNSFREGLQTGAIGFARSLSASIENNKVEEFLSLCTEEFSDQGEFEKLKNLLKEV